MFCRRRQILPPGLGKLRRQKAKGKRQKAKIKIDVVKRLFSFKNREATIFLPFNF